MEVQLNTETGYTQEQVEAFLGEQEKNGKHTIGYDVDKKWFIKQNGFEFRCKEPGTKELYYFIGRR